jgi:type II restriction enzyme
VSDEKKYSFISQLENINPKWVNNSRIYGQAIEAWIEENFICECSGKHKVQRANLKSIDAICSLCENKIQIKASGNKFKPNKSNRLKIIGAEYKTTLNSIMIDKWDLILISYNKEQASINQIIRVKSAQITEKSIIPRIPLKETARRAGWQGCYLEFDFNVLEIIY